MQIVLKRWEVVKDCIEEPTPPLTQAIVLLDESLYSRTDGWDETKTQLLKLIGDRMTATEWALYFNVTEPAVRHRALRLGIKLKPIWWTR